MVLGVLQSKAYAGIALTWQESLSAQRSVSC